MIKRASIKDGNKKKNPTWTRSKEAAPRVPLKKEEKKGSEGGGEKANKKKRADTYNGGQKNWKKKELSAGNLN